MVLVYNDEPNESSVINHNGKHRSCITREHIWPHFMYAIISPQTRN